MCAQSPRKAEEVRLSQEVLVTRAKPHHLQPQLSLYSSPGADGKTQKQGLEAEDAGGGPSGSCSEPKDLPEVTKWPYPTLGSLRGGQARLQLAEETTHLGNSLSSAPTYPIPHDFWPPKNSRSSALCKAMLIPASRLCSNSVCHPISKSSPIYPTRLLW